ncbi:MAG: glycosyltransferase family 2 protein [Nitrospirae bacterium]|nr:glycosyltransferase family 2 protein [Nitrospirota bacterium]
MPSLASFIIGFNHFILAYYTTVNLLYTVLMVIAAVVTTRHIYRIEYGGYKDIFNSSQTPPVSIIVPAHNEAQSIVENVKALLALNYPSFEVIVINDGSNDDTLEHLSRSFSLRSVNQIYRPVIKTNIIKDFYVSSIHPNLTVINKPKSGKSDSLNVGVNVARYPYFCCIDADTLIEKDAFLRLVRPIIESKEPVVACGGILRIANGCTVRNGEVTKIALPGDLLSRLQIIEYLRAFLFGRAGWSAINSLMLISGAFSLFHKRSVQQIGGFSSKTVSEDMEMVVRLHRFMRKSRKPYRVVFISDPVGWTEVPSTLKMLKKQRIRWHRGLVESLLMNISMLFNPRYGRIGLFAMPYQVLIEVFSPLIEIIGYLVVVLSFVIGIISWRFFILFLLLAIVYSIFLSAGAVLLEEITYKRYPRWGDMLRLISLSIVENLGYRQINSWWRARALLHVLVKPSRWEAVKKKGFKKEAEIVNSEMY